MTEVDLLSLRRVIKALGEKIAVNVWSEGSSSSSGKYSESSAFFSPRRSLLRRGTSTFEEVLELSLEKDIVVVWLYLLASGT